MTEYERDLLSYLQTFLTPQRKARFTEVLEKRTRSVVIVLVDLYQEHNASAVLRSCEAFGIQDVYVVESENQFSTKRDIAMGSDRWLTIHRFGGEKGLAKCLRTLKRKGFATVATVLNGEDHSIYDVEVTSTAPLALMIGTEDEGLPSAAIDQADLCVSIPMFGFVESFNVSVAAALCLQVLTYKLRTSNVNWKLTFDESEALRLAWARQSIPNCAAIERRFLVDRTERLAEVRSFDQGARQDK